MKATRPPFVVVIDYGIGNLRSAQKALEKVGADAMLTDDAGLIARADALVLPGVGAFGPCMDAMDASGLTATARESAQTATKGGRPFLAICVGMQLLYEGSDESPGREGLGVLPGRVRLLPDGVKRPQMQWNRLRSLRPSALLEGLDGEWMYFVHSYSTPRDGDTIATCDYGGPVPAALARGSLQATQFHPEKSATAGLRLLANFVRSLG